MKEHGFPNLYNYINDLIYIGLLSKIDCAFTFRQKLLGKLGLQISDKKLVPPSTSVVCLGIQIDTIAKTISIPSKITRNCLPLFIMGHQNFLQ